MKILWQSASPLCNSGYGKISREAITRLQAAGHDITFATKHPQFGNADYNGIPIIAGQDIAYLNELMERGNFNYVFTLWDIWMLADKRKLPKEKWVAYIPIDTNGISALLNSVVKETSVQVAMSRHGERALREAGYKPVYAPHGVDTATLRPDAEGRVAFRESFGWDDETFVIGSVGLNYKDDRKGFIPLMQAFKAFHERHPKSRLYLHTDAGTKRGETIPFAAIAMSLGIGEWVAWPHQMSYALNFIDEAWLRSVYNGFDVFCLPTRGEGFGIPTVDAQACGVPVIVTDNTTGPELCKSGWLIDVYARDLRWLQNDAWRYEPQWDAVLARLEEAYEAWRGPEWGNLKAKAREGALEYGWDQVWPKYWEPIIGELASRLASPGTDKGKA